MRIMQRLFSSTLVSSRWLNEVIKSDISKRRILDATWHLPNTGRNAFQEFCNKHIPGAVFFDIDECADKSSSLPHMIPTVETFEKYVGGLGICNQTHVIVYDNHPKFPVFSAQRVWWTFRLFGHTNISILDGGLSSWLGNGGAVTDKVSQFEPATFKVKFNRNLIKYIDDVQQNIDHPKFLLVDARPEERFKGIAQEPRSGIKPGCIPNSVSIPFVKLMNLEEQRLKSPQELRQVFLDAGVDLNNVKVAATCGSGISACLVALAGHLCGLDDIAVYDGSWTEWFEKAPPHLKSNIPL